MLSQKHTYIVTNVLSQTLTYPWYNNMTHNEKTTFLVKSYGNLWLLYILFGIIIAILSVWFPEVLNKEYEQTAILDMAQNNPIKLLIMACVFAPIVEEMMFRTLIKPSHSDLILCICSWPVFLGAGFLPESIHWAIRLGFSGILLFTTHAVLKQLIPAEKTAYLRSKLSTYVLPVLIVSSIFFGLVHISNYVDSFTFNATLVLLVVPQVIAGFILGWVKKKNEGLVWPIILHFMNNIVPVSIIILSSRL